MVWIVRVSQEVVSIHIHIGNQDYYKTCTEELWPGFIVTHSNTDKSLHMCCPVSWKAEIGQYDVYLYFLLALKIR